MQRPDIANPFWSPDVQKTLEPIGLEIIDIVRRAKLISGVRNSCVYSNIPFQVHRPQISVEPLESFDVRFRGSSGRR